jgi:ABC-type oligopeptide transport system substrate-binding subunit
VVKRNPNYHGPRPQHLDAIVYEFGIAPPDAVARIDTGQLDYIADQDAELAPATTAARSAGPRYDLTYNATASTQYLVFNTHRPLFASIRHRRAVEYALDRRTLAAIDTAIPATRVLSPRLPSFNTHPLYPLQGNAAKARTLIGGRHYNAVLAVYDPSSSRQAAALPRAVRNQLAAIGISVTVIPLTNNDYANNTRLLAKERRSDLIWGRGNVNGGDPVKYLQGLSLSSPYSNTLEHIATLPSPQRDTEAAALATTIDRQALYAVYEDEAIPELHSPRLGCVTHQPEYTGIDLAALCLKKK